MTVDDLVGRRRYFRLRRVAFAMAVCALAGVVFLSVHGWQSSRGIVAQAPPPSVDPIQTGSVAVSDAIGGMIEKLDGKAVGRHD